MVEPHELPWKPLTPDETRRLFSGWDRFWCIAGGWSIDLNIGQVSRDHADVDVLVLRRDMDTIHELLPGWELWAADPPGSLRLWPASEPLPPHVHDIWCRPEGERNWQFQLMVMDHDNERWVFRRDRAIGGPLESLRVDANGIPVIAPEVQLLFKSKGLRPKDEADFRVILPHLSPEQRSWLRRSLETHDPQHPWIPVLTSASIADNA